MTITRWDIDSMSGVWIAVGTFIVYCVSCLAIGLWDKYQFRKARRQRQKYELTIKKEREVQNENHN